MAPKPGTPPTSSCGTVVASGYGLKIHVHRGHLVIDDGIAEDRQTRRFNRATSKLKRVVVLGHSGFLTLEALRWMRDVSAGFVQIDADGKLIALSAAHGPDLADLRRAQALALTSDVGIEITRGLLGEKLRGQAALLEQLSVADSPWSEV